jgi:hypothetical protein
MCEVYTQNDDDLDKIKDKSYLNEEINMLELGKIYS